MNQEYWDGQGKLCGQRKLGRTKNTGVDKESCVVKESWGGQRILGWTRKAVWSKKAGADKEYWGGQGKLCVAKESQGGQKTWDAQESWDDQRKLDGGWQKSWGEQRKLGSPKKAALIKSGECLRKFRRDRVHSITMMKGFLIYDEMCKSLVKYEEAGPLKVWE